MKWIKASERMPKISGRYNARLHGTTPVIVNCLPIGKNQTLHFSAPGSPGLIWKNYQTTIEWLDESVEPLMENQQTLASESNKKLVDLLVWSLDKQKELTKDQAKMYEKIVSRKSSEILDLREAILQFKEAVESESIILQSNTDEESAGYYFETLIKPCGNLL